MSRIREELMTDNVGQLATLFDLAGTAGAFAVLFGLASVFVVMRSGHPILFVCFALLFGAIKVMTDFIQYSIMGKIHMIGYARSSHIALERCLSKKEIKHV